jgi:hypothetical protein
MAGVLNRERGLCRPFQWQNNGLIQLAQLHRRCCALSKGKPALAPLSIHHAWHCCMVKNSRPTILSFFVVFIKLTKMRHNDRYHFV